MIADLWRDLIAARALRRCSRLASIVYKPQGVRIWLAAKNRNLGGNSPIDVILDGNGDLAIAEANRLAGL
jgi:hypothetical protein